MRHSPRVYLSALNGKRGSPPVPGDPATSTGRTQQDRDNRAQPGHAPGVGPAPAADGREQRRPSSTTARRSTSRRRNSSCFRISRAPPHFSYIRYLENVLRDSLRFGRGPDSGYYQRTEELAGTEGFHGFLQLCAEKAQREDRVLRTGSVWQRPPTWRGFTTTSRAATAAR